MGKCVLVWALGVAALCVSAGSYVRGDEDDWSSSEILHPVESKAECGLDAALIKEIADYAPTVQRIIDTVLTGDYKGKLWFDTAEFVDTIGARVVGSEALEKGIDYMIDWMKGQGFDDVHGEEIETPDWIRGTETLEMIEPRYQKLRIIGYGTSVGTNNDTIEAEIIVVRDYKELDERSDEVEGKIVVYDHKFIDYGTSVMYRNTGAPEAAKRGAVAALVAAVSNQAMDLPHTGQMRYDSNASIPRIPLASISVDAAEMLGRMHRRGNNITLRLFMDDESPEEMATSRNVFGQMNGAESPDEKVIVSGHIDSWDVGQGAQDDGAAVVMSTLVISLLKHLNLTTRRTIQAVGWTSEENGLVGVQGYIKTHAQEIADGKIVAALESDSGLFAPLGYDFAGSDEAACMVEEILKLFQGLNFTMFNRAERVGSDISYLSELNVPTFNFRTDSWRYMWYHHAESDTMSALNSDELDLCLAAYTASVYVIADLSKRLPLPNPGDGTTTVPPSSTVPSTTTMGSVSSVSTQESTTGGSGVLSSFLPASFIAILVYLKNIMSTILG